MLTAPWNPGASYFHLTWVGILAAVAIYQGHFCFVLFLLNLNMK